MMARLIDRLREQHARLFEPMPVDVPEWETTLYIRPLTLAEAMKIASMPTEERMAPLLAWSLTDADGQPVFTEDEIRDMPVGYLGVLQRLAEQASSSLEVIEKKYPGPSGDF